MKILLIGSGGREHSLAWKIAQSPLLTQLIIAPGSDAMAALGTCHAVKDTDIDGLVALAQKEAVDLVVVGPEAPLAAGLGDALARAKIACFGPSQAAAQLESSKGFVKDLCAEYDIPTARYGRFTDAAAAKNFLTEMTAPYVIKADGLAAGKGVIIADDLATAEAAIDDMLGGQFGIAGAELVIEEFMHGEEASFFALTDGETILPLIAAQDHKRAFDGDKGPNTGGMGAYSPAPVFTDDVYQATMEKILKPTVRAMKEKGIPYVGVLYAGLMVTEEGPKLIEYNARFGDPECQILMRRMESDIVPALKAAADGTLADISLDWHEAAAALIVMAANGYPGSYEKGSIIDGVDAAASLEAVEVFHAGTKEAGDTFIANGGRVLNITATGATGEEAITRAYEAIDKINWPGGFYRRDIGWRLLQREA